MSIDPAFLHATTPVPRLDVEGDVVALTAAVVDVFSVSHHEAALADAVESALTGRPHLQVRRDGNTVIARTDLGRDQRVVVAGHLDTVPEHDNLPSRFETVDGQERLYGLGACDMKGGVAVALHLAATLSAPTRDVTWLFYEAEEVEEEHNGLRRIAQSNPQWLAGDFAVVMEPSNAGIEAGCQGTMRMEVRATGKRSHSARSWMGENAIHKLAVALDRLNSYQPRRVMVDGLEYREGLNAVAVSGGVAGNVIPDEAVLAVNYRFAPSRSADEAEQHLRELFDGFELTVTDRIDGALPGLGQPAAEAFLAAVGGEPKPKFGWTDVARFSMLGVPAVNYGPGDPMLAHTRDEFTPVAQVRAVEAGLRAWLLS
ncbi:MAG TPA: succinyl-diaminopimelate desuccinylase [Candidatus Nanopelagicales bacterium]|jgi:succinyl-diaminopimelate desuccinylase|nr:succinyl-diaminopimelate desuccinylase [Candidatus Nanopelagicales bacterium]